MKRRNTKKRRRKFTRKRVYGGAEPGPAKPRSQKDFGYYYDAYQRYLTNINKLAENKFNKTPTQIEEEISKWKNKDHPDTGTCKCEYGQINPNIECPVCAADAAFSREKEGALEDLNSIGPRKIELKEAIVADEKILTEGGFVKTPTQYNETGQVKNENKTGIGYRKLSGQLVTTDNFQKQALSYVLEAKDPDDLCRKFADLKKKKDDYASTHNAELGGEIKETERKLTVAKIDYGEYLEEECSEILGYFGQYKANVHGIKTSFPEYSGAPEECFRMGPVQIKKIKASALISQSHDHYKDQGNYLFGSTYDKHASVQEERDIVEDCVELTTGGKEISSFSVTSYYEIRFVMMCIDDKYQQKVARVFVIRDTQKGLNSLWPESHGKTIEDGLYFNKYGQAKRYNLASRAVEDITNPNDMFGSWLSEKSLESAITSMTAVPGSGYWITRKTNITRKVPKTTFIDPDPPVSIIDPDDSDDSDDDML